MLQFYNKLKTICIGKKDNTTSFENRLFISSTIIGTLACVQSTIWNLIVGLSLITTLASIIFTLVCFYFYFRARFHRVYHTIAFVFVSTIFIFISWFANDGINGTGSQLSIIFIIMILSFLQSSKHVWFLMIFIAVQLGVYWIEIKFPHFILPYPSIDARLNDIRFGLIISLCIVYVVFHYIKREYDNERVLNHKQQQDLHVKTQAIMIQNNELEMQKRKLLTLLDTKNRLLSVIAHDIKNPLNVIAGFSDMILKKGLTYEKEKMIVFAEHINQSATKANGLIQSLLEWSRVQSKEIKPKVSHFKILDLIHEVIQYVSENDGLKEHTINKNIPDDLMIKTDYVILSSIIRNIFANAVKFTPRFGLIHVKAYFEDVDSIIIAIQDNGIGMTLESIQHIKQGNVLSSLGTDNEKGTGLGLIICNDFVKVLGGKLRISSQIDQGSLFEVVLPRMYIDNDDDSSSGVLHLSDKHLRHFNSEVLGKCGSILNDKTILLVDEDTDSNQALAEVLTEYCHVKLASSAQDALEILGNTRIHLIICESIMDGFNGIEFCYMIKTIAKYRKLPFILLSADSALDVQIKAYTSGADAYILKPFHKEYLIAQLYSILYNKYENIL